MKNTILHWTSVLLAGTAMTLSACSSDDTDNGGDPAQSPVFPEETQLTIFAGETSVELSFTPNLDWTASLPTSSEASRWFKISEVSWNRPSRSRDMPARSPSPST